MHGIVVVLCVGSLARADLMPVVGIHRPQHGQSQITVPGVPGAQAVKRTVTVPETQHTEQLTDKDDIPVYLTSPVTPRYLQKRGTIVFSDDFTAATIDSTKWTHASTGWGGGNHEFNMYTPEAVNSYIKHQMLYIKPTLTVDHFGDDYLTNGVFDASALWGQCSSLDNRGCHLSGHCQIPPTMSAMLMTKTSIRYGRVTVIAKLPKGDWLWPAIWLLPTEKHYGDWPRSGEIDIMEARAESQEPLFSDSFLSYWMDWTADYIRMGVDDHTMLAWDTPAHGYWQESQLQGDDIWASGGRDAPFDRPFYLILNVAVGGGWFWESMENAPYPQPWQSNATKAEQFTQFWNARHLWEPTWHGENVAMKIRSVTMEQY